MYLLTVLGKNDVGDELIEQARKNFGYSGKGIAVISSSDGEGGYDPVEIQTYAGCCTILRSAGIEPMGTLQEAAQQLFEYRNNQEE